MNRILTRKDAYFLVVGNIIGIGIFTTTGYVANYVPTAGILLFVWLLGGTIAFFGAVTYAELATQFPRPGGDYHFLSRAFHPLYGFLFGWAAFVVTYTGSIATLSVGFAHYFLNLFPANWRMEMLRWHVLGIHLSALQIIAIAVAGIFTYFNANGLRPGARWQMFLTVLSVLVLMGFVVLGFTSPARQWNHLTPLFPNNWSFRWLGGIATALVGVYFTYSGWTTVAYVAGEIREPQRSIPFAMITGLATVTGLYLLMNFVYLLALPVQEMRNVVDIGFRVLQRLQGERWSVLFSVMIMLAVLSTLNATILSGARIYYAMARDGLFFRRAGMLHPQTGVPRTALWYQYLWSVVLILSGSFNQLLTYTVFVMVGFAASSGISLLVFRFKNVHSGEKYQAWGYPWTTLIYIALMGFILLSTLLNRPEESLLGLLAVAVGIPVYFVFNKKAENKKPRN